MLTNNVLLEVFDWYLKLWNKSWKWITLVHVCRRWRHIVFGSRRLELCLLCTYGAPVRRRLDCWSSLPIDIKYWANLRFRPSSPKDEDNLIATLEHPGHVSEIQLPLTGSLLEKVAKQMLVRFPALTSLSFWLDKGTGTPPTSPTTFLAGCYSCLRDISFIGISSSRLPELLASNTDLVSLRLLQVPCDGYNSPDVIATCLSKLSHLRMLCTEFHSPPFCRYNQEHIRPPMETPSLKLPFLTQFNFLGTSEYLKDLVTRPPFLSQVNITFFNQLIFSVPRLSRFTGQIEGYKSAKIAEVESPPGNGVSKTITLDPNQLLGYFLTLRVTCTDSDRQMSAVAQICHQAFSLLSNVADLDIRADCLRKEEYMDPIAWLEFSDLFPSVGMLRISGELGPHVAPALEVVDEETTRALLPELRMLLFECALKSAVNVHLAIFPCIWDYAYT